MYETYRMLGREHELDLEREAHKLHLGASVRRPTARPVTLVVKLVTALFSELPRVAEWRFSHRFGPATSATGDEHG